VYKNNVSLIPRLNASIALPCLVLNVYRILVSTSQNLLIHLATGPTTVWLVGSGFGGRRTARFRRFLGRRNGVVHRLSSAPVPTTCFTRLTPSRNVCFAPTNPSLCGGVNASEKHDGLTIFRPFP